jgi:hypothetical protein
MLASGVVVVHYSAHSCTAPHTQALLEYFNWKLFDYPPCSPDLALNGYHYFPHMKNWLRSHCCNNNEELIEGVKTWLSSQVAEFFDTVTRKLIP